MTSELMEPRVCIAARIMKDDRGCAHYIRETQERLGKSTARKPHLATGRKKVSGIFLQDFQ